VGKPPPRNVLRAFGLRASTPLTPLAGGLEQTAWRAGDVVLKPVQAANPGEGDWVATVLDAIVEDGFRVIKPVRASDGRWLENGWAAWHWIEGAHERTRWREVLIAAEAFHRALLDAVAGTGVDMRPAWLDTRGHRWAVAEGVVWRDEPPPAQAIYDVPEWELWERARAAGPPLTADEAGASQVVHGDIASNVLAGPDGTPAFIDMSPGWRPPSSAHAQVFVEGVVWRGGDESLLASLERADVARACAFRLMCGFQALTIGLTFNPAETARFRRVLDLVGA
jgi:uncharacterized protein (TIGR02569 family)